MLVGGKKSCLAVMCADKENGSYNLRKDTESDFCKMWSLLMNNQESRECRVTLTLHFHVGQKLLNGFQPACELRIYETVCVKILTLTVSLQKTNLNDRGTDIFLELHIFVAVDNTADRQRKPSDKVTRKSV